MLHIFQYLMNQKKSNTLNLMKQFHKTINSFSKRFQDLKNMSRLHEICTVSRPQRVSPFWLFAALLAPYF